MLFRDATCPNCGSLLWFFNVESTRRVYERPASHSIRERVIALVANQLNLSPDKVAENTSLVNDPGADSLDVVELVMELEDEFDRP